MSAPTPYTAEMVEFEKVRAKIDEILEPYNLRMREAIGGVMYFGAVVEKFLEEAGDQGFDDIKPLQAYILHQFKHYLDSAFSEDAPELN